MPVKKTNTKTLPLTPPVEEGPYYTPGSPERKNIADPGTPGTRLILEGRVLDKNGEPISHAWLDFWSADGHGKYDNEGFNLRGHQYTDKDGHYHLETVRPHEYLMRSPHLHVKVRAGEKAPVFTTQLFFPMEKTNATDYLFTKGTLVAVKAAKDGQTAKFDFVIEK
jgi:protocatechuate 3,4-dioxygenase beta subunit